MGTDPTDGRSDIEEASVGDIGEEQPEIEVMPVRQPREAPAEPTPSAPVEPAPAPERDPEKVPA